MAASPDMYYSFQIYMYMYISTRPPVGISVVPLCVHVINLLKYRIKISLTDITQMPYIHVPTFLQSLSLPFCFYSSRSSLVKVMSLHSTLTSQLTWNPFHPVSMMAPVVGEQYSQVIHTQLTQSDRKMCEMFLVHVLHFC